MKAELISFGFVIGGPKDEHWVATREEIEPKVAELSAAQGYDSDEYTATEVFAKAWSGSFDTVPNPQRGYDWDDTYKDQT